MDTLSVKNQNKIAVLKGFADPKLGWENFEKLFDTALEMNKVLWGSFATMNIDNSESMTEDLDHLLSMLSEVHHGEMITALSLIHFENGEDNNIPKEAQSLYSKFINNNPQKKPSDFTPSMMIPTIHSDPVDGMFVQCVGSVVWTGYYDGTSEEWVVEPGDLVYIPKGVSHSVKSLHPRCSISVAFTD
jgi:hypothetical protein